MATGSYQHLTQVVNELTLEEVQAALALEAKSRRRKSIVNRLIARFLRIVELDLQETLTRRYGGTRWKAEERPIEKATAEDIIATASAAGRLRRKDRDIPDARRFRARAAEAGRRSKKGRR